MITEYARSSASPRRCFTVVLGGIVLGVLIFGWVRSFRYADEIDFVHYDKRIGSVADGSLQVAAFSYHSGLMLSIIRIYAPGGFVSAPETEGVHVHIGEPLGYFGPASSPHQAIGFIGGFEWNGWTKVLELGIPYWALCVSTFVLMGFLRRKQRARH